MKAGDVFKSRTNERVGIRIESYVGSKQWRIQSIDFIEGRPTRTYIFEQASAFKIKKFYQPHKEKHEDEL